ncbi:DapH/DapD/GlmU-related protein [Lactiplantibacillus xiangfangensis]|uniref:acyltransferase n=1 Tax=Lactiplantibacillus xiangfangensis TaxID=942150 RepID=UPI000343832D|nr:putative acetyltransferase [Lacticaseibacillus paracasei subsp. paracasei Lpp227]
MPQISDEVSLYAKIQIIISTIAKVGRGIRLKPFLKKSTGPLFVGKHVKLMNSQYISVGKNVKFEDYSEVQGLSTAGLIFGNSVTVGRGVLIRPSSYYGVGHIGDGLIIGNNSSIGPNGFIGCAGLITIGENVMIGPGVTMIAENHVFKDEYASIKSQGVVQKGITIEEDVWIGANVTILDGVIVHHGSVIGASTIITRDIPADSVVIDRREKKIKERNTNVTTGSFHD